MALKAIDSASARQAKYGATAGLYVIVIIAVLVMINWLADRYNKSYDTTTNKRYTLSDQSKKIVNQLKTGATITYIDRTSQFDQAKALLDRYANLSPKIHIQYVDFVKNPTVARSYNLKYPGTAFVEVNGKKEEAKSMTEEGITGGFIRAEKGGTKKVCFVQGGGEHTLDETGSSGLSRFKEGLGKESYDAVAVSLLQKAAVPNDCTVLVIAGPQYDYPQPEVDAIKNYIQNAGRALFLIDPPLQMGRSTISKNDALDKMLTDWGVTLEGNLVLEVNPIGQLFGIGPQVPLITSYGTQPIVSDLHSATGFPLAQSMTIANKDKTTVDKLFSTGDASEATSNLSSGSVTLGDSKNKKGPFVLGAAGTYNTGKPNQQGRFVVIGNSGFAANNFISFNANRDLAMNIINWLAQDEDLISIRPKETEDRRINVNAAQMRMFFYFSLIALPLLIIGTGVSVFLKRR
jgi:ABC-type uncharacterized transport system involved in gliding motility auxiliary subunit